MSRSEETRSLLNESLNNNLEKHKDEDEDKLSAGCFGNALLYIFLKIFDWKKNPTYWWRDNSKHLKTHLVIIPDVVNAI